MAVNFFTSNTVPTTGTLGQEVSIQRRRQQGVEQEVGQSVSFYGFLVTGAVDSEKVLNRMEKHMGYDSGSLSWGNSIQNADNGDNVLFRDVNGSYVDVEFDNNKYTLYSERELFSSFGIDYEDRPDIVTLTQGGFCFYDFTNTGLGDGTQDGFSLSGKFDNIKWGTTTYVQSELNTDYWWADDGSYESYKSNCYFDLIKSNANQFLSAYEIASLSTITDYTTWAYSMAQLADSRLCS